MEDPDELAHLRQLLAGLDSGRTTMRENGVDVTEREKEKLRVDVAGLEKRLARNRPGTSDA
jgi:IS5 family transposase